MFMLGTSSYLHHTSDLNFDGSKTNKWSFSYNRNVWQHWQKKPPRNNHVWFPYHHIYFILSYHEIILDLHLIILSKISSSKLLVPNLMLGIPSQMVPQLLSPRRILPASRWTAWKAPNQRAPPAASRVKLWRIWIFGSRWNVTRGEFLVNDDVSERNRHFSWFWSPRVYQFFCSSLDLVQVMYHAIGWEKIMKNCQVGLAGMGFPTHRFLKKTSSESSRETDIFRIWSGWLEY